MAQKMLTGVFGLAYDGKDKYLLTLRGDPDNDDADHQWQIPGGGMEFGEQPETTCIRELQEEIICTPKIINPRPIVTVSVWPAKKEGELDYHVTLITYLVTIDHQIPQKTEESLECTWYTVDQIMTLNTLPNVKETVMAFSKTI